MLVSLLFASLSLLRAVNVNDVERHDKQTQRLILPPFVVVIVVVVVVNAAAVVVSPLSSPPWPHLSQES